jgi:hypothetical protein
MFAEAPTRDATTSGVQEPHSGRLVMADAEPPLLAYGYRLSDSAGPARRGKRGPGRQLAAPKADGCARGEYEGGQPAGRGTCFALTGVLRSGCGRSYLPRRPRATSRAV